MGTRFASEFRRRRQELGLRQEDAARACRVSQSVISRWEGGEDIPSPQSRDAVAAFLDCTPQELENLISQPRHPIEHVAAELHRLVDELVRHVRDTGESEGEPEWPE